MRLQILITQYEETEEIIRPMLESIGYQLNVDLAKDVEVVIGNDGSDVKLSDSFLKSFGYPIRYLTFEHSGLPGTRGKLYDASSAEYLMFCDADDRFISAFGLQIIFSYMEKGFDAFASAFRKETRLPGGRVTFSTNEHDGTFVHGKVYRRQYLADNHIVWHPELMYHEDFVFNTLAQQLTKNFVYCPHPFYLWKWRDDSLCRKDPLHVLKTYPLKIDATERLVLDFLERGRQSDAAYSANICVFFCYYSMNGRQWLVPETAQYRAATAARIGAFIKKHKALIDSAAPAQKAAAIRVSRDALSKDGVLLVESTFAEWMREVSRE